MASITRRERRFPHRDEVLALVEAGVSYEDIGRRLGVNPGVAYLVATGLPADGSDAPSASTHDRPGLVATSQQLSNPPTGGSSTHQELVAAWIEQRVAADEPMRRAAAARAASSGS